MPKKYDTRSHDERIQALYIAFAECKANAYLSGKINDCSASKVLKESKVDRSYLYTEKLSDKEIQQRYHAIAKSIKSWRDEFRENKDGEHENTALAKAEHDIKQTTEERDNAQKQAAKYLTQVQGLKSQIDRMSVQHEKIIEQQTYQAQFTRATVATTQSTTSFSKTVIISQDSHLYVNGQYHFHDENLKERAWIICKDKLKKALNRKVITRVYLLVGPPCCGKSTWSTEPDVYPDRHSIIIDACNLTRLDRFEWYRVINMTTADCKVCVVYFDTPLSTLFARNNSRSSDKHIDDASIEEKFKSLEAINVVKETFIDEVKVIRSE
ncbi:hypothetical protein AB6D81_02030 [Vibrio splendidus]